MSIINVEHPLSVITAVSRVVFGGSRREGARESVDAVELSAKSRELYEEHSSLDHVRARIREGFYADPAILEEIISNLLPDAMNGLRGSGSSRT